MDKQTKRFSRDRGIATIHGIVTIPRSIVFTFFNVFFITVAFEAIEHGQPANCPPIVQFTNILGNVCFV